VREMGLGEYEQRFLISRDDYGATFIQAPCDYLLRSWSIPTSKTKLTAEKPSQRSRQKILPLDGIIKHNEAARSQSVKNKISKLRQICDFRDSGICRIIPRA
jgi:hypothetical protein